MDSILLLSGLTAIAAFSPLLTFAHLWQLKEWRIDRMREHLRNEGFLRQLFGITRPAIVIAGTVLIVANVLPLTSTVPGILLILAGASVLQVLLKKQPTPVWTKKAVILVGTSAILTILASLIAIRHSSFIILLIPLLEPLFLAIAWTAFFPLDYVMKRRIMEQASALRRRFSTMTVIGITGSVGKTTTKELLAHILKDRKPIVTPAYVNADVGIAQWLIRQLQGKEEAPEFLIVEMGAYRAGEITLLCTITKPTIGIITFIGKQHMALFGSQEELCRAKAELLDALPEDGHAFINGDSPLCADLRDHCRCALTVVGTGGHADIEAHDIEETSIGIRFRREGMIYDIPLHGTHNATNVLLAIAAAEVLEIPAREVAEKLRSFSPLSHTFSVRTEKGVTILDDTHNASPESFKAAIAWARTQPMERKILLTSGLIELGAAQDDIHTELGGRAAEVFNDVIFVHRRSAKNFAKGFGRNVRKFTKEMEKIPMGSLLVCIGRISPATIDRLLP